MTTLRQHIESLDPPVWAALTRRTAEAAVAAAAQVGEKPPPQLTAVAAMTEAELVQHRQKTGGAKRGRPTAQMRITEADHQRAMADQQARAARHARDDALADAAAARGEALAALEAADAARERARKADARSALMEAQRAAERQEAQAAVERLNAEHDQVLADAAAEVAAAREQARAALEHADQLAAQPAAVVELLSLPVSPEELRPATKRAETTLAALHQISYLLEVEMAEGGEGHDDVDAQSAHDLAHTVREQADTLPQELRALLARYSETAQAQAAAGYADAATIACRTLLQRISAAAQQFQHRVTRPAADALTAVIDMLTDPRVQSLFEQLSAGYA